ncbi:MAG: hypothetical protein R3B38_00435 [Patescibacteria group bacterium]
MIKPIVIGITIATLCSLAALALVLWYFDPATSGGLGLSLVLATLTFSLTGLLSLGFLWLHTRKRVVEMSWLLLSIRQGALVSLIVIGSFILGYFNILYWWYFPAGLIAVLLLEIYLRLRVE